MNRIFICLLATAMMPVFYSCNKESKNTEEPGNPNLSLPVYCDLTKLNIDSNTSFLAVAGVTFSARKKTYTITGGVGDWLSCVSSDQSALGYTGAGLGVFGGGADCLIADVSGLPALKKITVHLLDACGENCTQIDLCNGNDIIATVKGRALGDTSLVLFIGNGSGIKASGLYIHSLQATVKSVRFE